MWKGWRTMDRLKSLEMALEATNQEVAEEIERARVDGLRLSIYRKLSIALNDAVMSKLTQEERDLVAGKVIQVEVDKKVASRNGGS